MKDKKQARLRKKWKKSTVHHVILSVCTFLIVLVGSLFLMLNIVFHGPSQTASDMMAMACKESSAAKFVPILFLGEEGMQAAMDRNTLQEIDEDVDTALIHVAAEEAEENTDTPPIRIVDVAGSTYKGYMMIVRDPSRVIVGTCASKYGTGAPGKILPEIIEHYNGVGGLNAGGFVDKNGTGNGGTPLGLVISRGRFMSSVVLDVNSNTIIGFNEDDVLIVRKATNDADAKKLNLRDAVSFGPALIVNGKPASIKGAGSGVNPRSAIGQREDGAVLLLVIDGRQPGSVGASYGDLIKIMQDFGAVNAANLDGGSSSTMYYEGKQVNVGVLLTGGRALPTAFVVLPEETEGEAE